MKIVGLVGLAALFAGSCSALALLVTAAEAWRERTQAGWPEATATIEGCSVDLRYYDGPASDDPTWWLECAIGIGAGPGRIETKIHSGHRSNPAQGYPEPMNRWVNDHPVGSTIVVRYDPTDLKAIPTRDYLPNGEPRTLHDLEFLLAFTTACAALAILAIALRRIRPT